MISDERQTYLSHFCLYKNRVFVSLGMVLDQDLVGFIIAVSAHKPSWTLRDEAIVLPSARTINSTITTHKMNAICKREGHICSKDGMRQLQLLVIPVVLSPIAAAVMEPMKYEELNRDVKVSRSFGWPSSPSNDDPEMMQKTIPKPSTIRANRYMPTARISKKTSYCSSKHTILGKSLDDGSNHHDY